MKVRSFNTDSYDSQATKVEPVKVKDFSIDSYQEYTQSLNERCKKFAGSKSGVLVYRRVRVAEVFSYGCKNIQQSLEWQLGALKKSMSYDADIPNFLEPWYGIGVVSSAFGIDYIWNPGQAPAVKPFFETIDDALDYDIKPIKKTPVGYHSLRMIEYFLDQTKGKIPVSMGDIQSPFNNATNIVNTSNFLVSLVMEPEKVLKFLDLIADLQIDFYKEQEKLIGEALVKPGHGFACSQVFEGFGMSDDNIVMIDPESYMHYISPSFIKLGKAFGGAVHHSCGNFSDKVNMLKKIEGLRMVDAAFTAETDPHPNPPLPFRESFKNTGIIVNARMVGDINTVENSIRQLWQPGMKLVVVTYSSTPEEQSKVYQLIHNIARTSVNTD